MFLAIVTNSVAVKMPLYS